MNIAFILHYYDQPKKGQNLAPLIVIRNSFNMTDSVFQICKSATLSRVSIL